MARGYRGPVLTQGKLGTRIEHARQATRQLANYLEGDQLTIPAPRAPRNPTPEIPGGLWPGAPISLQPVRGVVWSLCTETRANARRVRMHACMHVCHLCMSCPARPRTRIDGAA